MLRAPPPPSAQNSIILLVPAGSLLRTLHGSQLTQSKSLSPGLWPMASMAPCNLLPSWSPLDSPPPPCFSPLFYLLQPHLQP